MLHCCEEQQEQQENNGEKPKRMAAQCLGGNASLLGARGLPKPVGGDQQHEDQKKVAHGSMPAGQAFALGGNFIDGCAAAAAVRNGLGLLALG